VLEVETSDAGLGETGDELELEFSSVCISGTVDSLGTIGSESSLISSTSGLATADISAEVGIGFAIVSELSKESHVNLDPFSKSFFAKKEAKFSFNGRSASSLFINGI
jgi:hypothetical protein